MVDRHSNSMYTCTYEKRIDVEQSSVATNYPPTSPNWARGGVVHWVVERHTTDLPSHTTPGASSPRGFCMK